MLKFIFWNLNNRPLERLVARLARQESGDVVVLAECEIRPDVLLRELEAQTSDIFSLAFSPAERIVIYTRFTAQWLHPYRDIGGLSIRRLKHPLYDELLVAAAHLSSKL